ncbi:transcription elongation factor GreA [candidate division KSB1 bacterium]|nr:transcription elongation factor GreA [candidate division KSB1 bacterium]RQW05710.1 MAG: transcription elongation factor GreA [candidate division KSB1 bacterium]
MKAMYLTREQYDKMTQELNYFKTVERKKAIADIATAREHGDLKENAEYAVAKEKQAFLEGKILRLEEALSRARILTDEMMALKTIRVGSRVKLYDTKWDEEVEYEIVPSAEFNPSDLDAVSVDSPVGKALVGKEVDDIVEIQVPAGTLHYKVIEIN